MWRSFAHDGPFWCRKAGWDGDLGGDMQVEKLQGLSKQGAWTWRTGFWTYVSRGWVSAARALEVHDPLT